jgi:hypothetical protein
MVSEAVHHFCAQVKQNPMVGRAKLLTSWWPGKEVGLGTKYTLEGHTPNDLFPTTRPHLLKFPPPTKISH